MANKFFEQLKSYQVHCDFTYTGEDYFNEFGTVKARNASEAIDGFVDKIMYALSKRTLPDTFRMLKVTVQEVW